MNPIRLSAVIITFNEEKNIGRCIDSLRPVIDEFIIVDSFSTDKTLAILKEKGIHPVQRAWEGFSGTKNFANALATGDFILSIDADEALSPELIKSVDDFKKKPVADACEITRLTNYCGQWIRHSGWYPEYKTRIFKKGLVEWQGTVHEELHAAAPYSQVKLKGNLLHYSFPTLGSHFSKILTYSSLAAEKDIEKGKKYFLLTHALIKPWFAFIRKYFLQLGFLDGFYGLVIAVSTAYERFLRYARYRELKK
jgi:glycosyltransferase involved in cell wall biosynthesis